MANNGGQSVISLRGGSGCGSPSLPLLSDAHGGMVQGGGCHHITTIESTLSNSQHIHQGHCQGIQENNSNPTLKPIARALSTIKRALFSKTARKLCCGLFLSITVACCWTIMFHSIKRAYLTMHLFPEAIGTNSTNVSPTSSSQLQEGEAFDTNKFFQSLENNNNLVGSSSDSENVNRTEGTSPPMKTMKLKKVFDAPFFMAWILTICTVMFYPIHQITVRLCSCMGRKGPKKSSRVSEAFQAEPVMTLFQFMARCSALGCLWLVTNLLIAVSLKTLKPTQVLTLFATSTSFLYMLSWVVLHYRFLAVKILAVILSNIGIALFAYMDGQTYRSTTIGGVVFGAASAATAAVFKVSLKKSFGIGATISQQVALIFSVVGIISIVALWPVFVTLYFTGLDLIVWSYVPWELILLALLSFLLVAMLENFGVTCTFEFFITIGLLMAIPFSAVLDYYLYNYVYEGMCLAGIIVIGVGFCVVLLPENWPDYITQLIRRCLGPSEEDKHQEPVHSTMPRLSRAGLENYLVNNPSPHSNSAVSVSSAHSHHHAPHHPNINNNITHNTAAFVNHQYF